MFTETELARLGAELAALHRDNARRDKIQEDMAADLKHLLALANQSKGGFWVGMSIASAIGGLASFIASHWGR